MFRSFGLDKAVDTLNLESGEGEAEDVLEVWFAGCHTGAYLSLSLPPINFELTGE